MAKKPIKPLITALYERLSKDDELKGGKRQTCLRIANISPDMR